MNEISITCSADGVEVSLKSDNLSLNILEDKALNILDRLQGEPSKPEGYHH